LFASLFLLDFIMADPLTALGGVASIIQIADVFLRLSSEFKHFVRTVRHAPQELGSFYLDLSNFSCSLHVFHKSSNSWLADLQESREKERKKCHIAGVIKECKVVKDGFNTLLEKFFGNYGQAHSTYSTIDRLRWYFRKPLAAGLKLSLECAKSSIMLFITLHMVEDLQQKVKQLEKDLQEVPESLAAQLYSDPPILPMQRTLIWDSRKSTTQQLRKQKKATKFARGHLQEHLRRSPYSAPILFPDIHSILDETEAMEQHATRSLRKEGRKIQQRSPSSRQSRYSQQRNPSPGSQVASRGHRRPRPSPPDLNSVPIPNTELTISAPIDRSGIRPTFQAMPENEEIRDNSSIPYVDPLHSRRSVQPERQSVPIRPQKTKKTKVYGSIIRDDGKEIRESIGEWRPEASELLRQSTDSVLSKADIALSTLSRSKERDTTVRRDSPKLKALEGTEQQGIVRTEVDFIEGGQRSSNAGTSPYRAVPPFLDEDWKGIRRSPST
jgi:hypothetical protein